MDGLVNSRLYGNDGCSSDHLTHFPSSSSSHGIESLWFPDSSPSFPEPSMVNFDGHTQGRGQGGARRSAPAPEKDEEEGDDDDGLFETEGVRNPYRRPGKKRRLAVEQVEQLERSFEEESKLEPERKIHLAKDLGLQPRQVAIWFQNRRARFKTKQLEREYHSLKANFDSLKADFDSLLKDKQTLQNEVSFLTNKLNQNEITGSVDPVHFGRLEAEAEKEAVGAPIYKQEEATSAKSDVVDSESPRCTEGNYTSVLEAVNLKLERSELSPEVEVLRRSFRAGAEYELGDVLEVYGSNLGLPGVEDHSNYWPWLY